MHITNRPWVITTIAAVTILFSIGPLFGSLFAIVSSLGQVLLNPFFLVVLVSSVVTTAAGIGLLMRNPWSRYCFMLTAIFLTIQFIFLFPFSTLFQAAIGNPEASKILHRVLPLTSAAVPFVLAWVATIIVFRYFKSMPAQPNQALNPDAPSSGAPVS